MELDSPDIFTLIGSGSSITALGLGFVENTFGMVVFSTIAGLSVIAAFLWITKNLE